MTLWDIPTNELQSRQCKLFRLCKYMLPSTGAFRHEDRLPSLYELDQVPPFHYCFLPQSMQTHRSF